MGRPPSGKKHPHAEVGARLKAARIRLGLTQQAMAEALGFRFASGYQKLESGQHRIDANVLGVLSQMGINPDEIIGDKEIAFPPPGGTHRIEDHASAADLYDAMKPDQRAALDALAAGLWSRHLPPQLFLELAQALRAATAADREAVHAQLKMIRDALAHRHPPKK